MQSLDVSAALLFQNDEEIIGTAVARLAEHLRTQGLRFELLAVGVSSHDNSTALLALLRKQHPELRIVTAPARRPHEHVATLARGHALWFLTPTDAIHALDSLTTASQQIAMGQSDLVVLNDRTALAHRERVRGPLRGLKSHGCQLPRDLVNRVRTLGLTVDNHSGSTAERPARSRWLAPLLSLFASPRAI